MDRRLQSLCPRRGSHCGVARCLAHTQISNLVQVCGRITLCFTGRNPPKKNIWMCPRPVPVCHMPAPRTLEHLARQKEDVVPFGWPPRLILGHTLDSKTLQHLAWQKERRLPLWFGNSLEATRVLGTGWAHCHVQLVHCKGWFVSGLSHEGRLTGIANNLLSLKLLPNGGRGRDLCLSNK